MSAYSSKLGQAFIRNKQVGAQLAPIL